MYREKQNISTEKNRTICLPKSIALFESWGDIRQTFAKNTEKLLAYILQNMSRSLEDKEKLGTVPTWKRSEIWQLNSPRVAQEEKGG